MAGTLKNIAFFTLLATCLLISFDNAIAKRSGGRGKTGGKRGGGATHHHTISHGGQTSHGTAATHHQQHSSPTAGSGSHPSIGWNLASHNSKPSAPEPSHVKSSASNVQSASPTSSSSMNSQQHASSQFIHHESSDPYAKQPASNPHFQQTNDHESNQYAKQPASNPHFQPNNPGLPPHQSAATHDQNLHGMQTGHIHHHPVINHTQPLSNIPHNYNPNTAGIGYPQTGHIHQQPVVNHTQPLSNIPHNYNPNPAGMGYPQTGHTYQQPVTNHSQPLPNIPYNYNPNPAGVGYSPHPPPYHTEQIGHSAVNSQQPPQTVIIQGGSKPSIGDTIKEALIHSAIDTGIKTAVHHAFNGHKDSGSSGNSGSSTGGPSQVVNNYYYNSNSTPNTEGQPQLAAHGSPTSENILLPAPSNNPATVPILAANTTLLVPDCVNSTVLLNGTGVINTSPLNTTEVNSLQVNISSNGTIESFSSNQEAHIISPGCINLHEKLLGDKGTSESNSKSSGFMNTFNVGRVIIITVLCMILSNVSLR